jgi:serine/threonine protein kinase/formylglycine-generating enzyme required for sulfatase activity
MSAPDDELAESLLACFLGEVELATPEEFDRWSEGRSEFAQAPDLHVRVRELVAAWIDAEALLRDSRFFVRGAGKRIAGDPEGLAGASLAPGRRIGRFELRRFVAQGGMGQVWEAWDSDLRRTIALKLVLPERISERSLALFAREARAGGRLEHPNIVRTYGYGNDDGLAWIAQELVSGSWTLKDFLDELRTSDSVPRDYYSRVAELVAQLADALQVAHAAGVIHRDIKPQNVLIAPDDRPKLTDFGLARVTDESLLSRSGEFAGTYAYASPEQIAGQRTKLDHRSDIFSLGVVLYELLTLRRPFEGDTTHQIAEQVVSIEPPYASRVRSQCPTELSLICGKAMEKLPAARYASMAELAADLRRHLAHEPIVARPPSVLGRAAKWSRRNPVLSTSGAIGLAALSVVSWLLAENVRARDEARRTAEDVLALSARQDLDDLVTEAASLWPPHPGQVPALESWQRRARELVEGRPANPQREDKGRPSLADHSAKLEELRRLAAPIDEAQLTADRESHPRFAELGNKRRELQWRARMLGLEPWPAQAGVDAELAREELPDSAAALDDLAWRDADFRQARHGRELHALALARRARELPDEGKGVAPDTLAWALLRSGKFEEAARAAEEGRAREWRRSPRGSALEFQLTLASWSPEQRAQRLKEHEAFAQSVARLERDVNARRTWKFDSPQTSWWNRELGQLVAALETLRDPYVGLLGDTSAPEFGWGIERRLRFARELGERSVSGETAQRLWNEARAAIRASPRYGGLELAPQMGLLPLGADPQSGLWEFAHLQTGEPALRGADGKLALTEETGIVLVLVPGGTFAMGAQSADPKAPNHDPQCANDESPVHEVDLAPYFLSKHELTQGQWLRVAGRNPAAYAGNRYQSTWNRAGHPWTPLLPVEQVSWNDCVELLGRLDLGLPTEAQWEFAARGGTSTVFWTGNDAASLQGAANVADSFGKANGNASWVGWESAVDDGYSTTAPIGSYRPNPFGLHDVHGNVREWCADGSDPEFYARGPRRDPFSAPGTSIVRATRDGAFNDTASGTRAANRSASTGESRSVTIGVRPARRIDAAP